jgi:hypothetical protein
MQVFNERGGRARVSRPGRRVVGVPGYLLF